MGINNIEALKRIVRDARKQQKTQRWTGKAACLWLEMRRDESYRIFSPLASFLLQIRMLVVSPSIFVFPSCFSIVFDHVVAVFNIATISFPLFSKSLLDYFSYLLVFTHTAILTLKCTHNKSPPLHTKFKSVLQSLIFF